MVTVKQIKALVAGQYDKVLQVDTKQLFIVGSPLQPNLPKQRLLSYTTIVGYKKELTWYLTTRKYSRTTSKQLSQFANRVRQHGCAVVWQDIAE